MRVMSASFPEGAQGVLRVPLSGFLQMRGTRRACYVLDRLSGCVRCLYSVHRSVVEIFSSPSFRTSAVGIRLHARLCAHVQSVVFLPLQIPRRFLNTVLFRNNK